MTVPERFPRENRWALALFIVTAAAALRMVFAALMPLFPDEAYYWDWSRHLAAGYFDHPPGIALLIRLGDVVFADFGASATPLAVRFGPVIAGWIAAMATIAIARRLAGDGAAFRAAVIMTVLPLAAAGLLLATPDSPVLATEAIALYGVVRALQSAPSSRGSLGWWTFAGIALGLAFCSKYTSIFVPLAVVIAIVLRSDLRARLKELGPYVACIVAALVFLPVLVWNAHHGWISFLFQIRHGLSAPHGSAVVAAFKHEGDFFGGQAGLASPILFVLLVIATIRGLTRRASGAEFALAMVAAITFAFFIWSGIRQRVEPNWPSPAYIPAIALLGATRFGRTGKRWLTGGVALAGLISAVIYVQGVVPILPIRPPRDPVARAFGWRDVTLRASAIAQQASAQTQAVTWLGGDRYQEASELAFNDPLHRPTFATNLSGRVNQYELWPGFRDRARTRDNLLLVLDDSDEPPDAIRALQPYFASVQRDDRVELKRGTGVVGVRRFWLLEGWRGGWPRATEPAIH